MNRHLNHQEMAELLSSSSIADAAVARHIYECERCAAEFNSMKASIGALREHLHAASLAPRRNRANAPSRVSSWRLRPAYAAATLLLLLALLALPRLVNHGAQAPGTDAQTLADNALLSQLETDLSRRGPAALAPASVLPAAERNDGKKKIPAGADSSNRTKKAR
jgi:anti-sigma factor RsiW